MATNNNDTSIVTTGVLRGGDGGVLGRPPMVSGKRLQLERGHSRLCRLGGESRCYYVGPNEWLRVDRPDVLFGCLRGAPRNSPVVQVQRMPVVRGHLRRGGKERTSGRAQVV